jgi:predicted regulator of Ras-like GTPase activity (Roadblock/LC7/MglB family)
MAAFGGNRSDQDDVNMQLAPVRRILDELTELDGVRSAFFAARDGLALVVAGEASNQGGADLRAALVAAVFATVDRAISQLDMGTAEFIAVETETNTLHMVGLGDFLLGVVSQRRTNPSLVRFEMRRVGRRVVELMDQPDPSASR